MNEGYTPSEFLEAQEKKEKHDQGREEAAFYRAFLDSLKREVLRQINRKDLNQALGNVDLNTTNLPLRQFEYCDPQFIAKYIQDAGAEAAKITGQGGVRNLSSNPEQLANMTPAQFVRYIEKLKSSLIKWVLTYKAAYFMFLRGTLYFL